MKYLHGSIHIILNLTFNDLPFMPVPEPDPVPTWNDSFTWNEEQHTFIIFNYVRFFYKEAIKQQQMYINVKE